MKNKNQLKDQERRAFIKKSTLAGAAVAATTLASTPAIAQVSEEIAQNPGQQGYQLTQHRMDYYQSSDL